MSDRHLFLSDNFYVGLDNVQCPTVILSTGIIQQQLFQYIEKLLSPFLCGYRKSFSTQTAVLGLVEKWKASLDKKGYAGAVLMGLSKSFDTINH